MPVTHKLTEMESLTPNVQTANVDGFIEEGKKVARKHIEFELHGVWGPNKKSPLKPEQVTPTGWPAVSVPVLRSLAGKPGTARKALSELPDSSISSVDGERPATSCGRVATSAASGRHDEAPVLDGDGAAVGGSLVPGLQDSPAYMKGRAV